MRVADWSPRNLDLNKGGHLGVCGDTGPDPRVRHLWSVWFLVPVWEMLCGEAVCNFRGKLNWGTRPGKDIRLGVHSVGRADRLRQGTTSSSRFGTAGVKRRARPSKCRLPITDSQIAVHVT